MKYKKENDVSDSRREQHTCLCTICIEKIEQNKLRWFFFGQKRKEILIWKRI